MSNIRITFITHGNFCSLQTVNFRSELSKKGWCRASARGKQLSFPQFDLFILLPQLVAFETAAAIIGMPTWELHTQRVNISPELTLPPTKETDVSELRRVLEEMLNQTGGVALRTYRQKTRNKKRLIQFGRAGWQHIISLIACAKAGNILVVGQPLLIPAIIQGGCSGEQFAEVLNDTILRECEGFAVEVVTVNKNEVVVTSVTQLEPLALLAG